MIAGFDKYERRARAFPGFLACAPIGVLVATFGWKRYPAIAVIGGLIVAAGGTYLMTLLVRHLGRKIQPGLWAKWGGQPTTRFLRANQTEGNPVERSNWRQAVEKTTAIVLPSGEEEAQDPLRADQTIEAAIGQLTRLGRDPAHPLIKEENINYGFERNAYGLRWYGRGISFAASAIIVAALAFGSVHFGGQKVANPALVAGLVINVLFLLGWVFLPSLDRTRDAADRYATELLNAVVVEARKPDIGGQS